MAMDPMAGGMMQGGPPGGVPGAAVSPGAGANVDPLMALRQMMRRGRQGPRGEPRRGGEEVGPQNPHPPGHPQNSEEATQREPHPRGAERTDEQADAPQ